MPLPNNPLGILPDHMFQACYGAFFNSLIRDASTKRMPARLFFHAETFGFQKHLYIPVEDVFDHLGEIREIEHEGRLIKVKVPGGGNFVAAAAMHNHRGLFFDANYQRLTAFFDRLMTSAGEPALEHPIVVIQQLTPNEVEDRWQAFMRELDKITTVFKAQRSLQAEGISLLHPCLAEELLSIAAQGPLRRAENREADQQPLDPKERRRWAQIADQRKTAVARVEQTYKKLIEMYFYYFQGSALPGAIDPPIWRLLPPHVGERLREEGKIVVTVDPPVEPDDEEDNEPDEERQEGEDQEGEGEDHGEDKQAQPVQDELVAVAGLIEIHPGDPLLQHPRLVPYLAALPIGVGGEKVYRTRYMKRDDYLLIPLPPVVTSSGQCVMALISLHDGHAADYFFLAGKPGDPSRTRLRWTKLVKYSRERLLMWVRKRAEKPQPPSKIYIGREFHDKDNPERHLRRVRARLARH